MWKGEPIKIYEKASRGTNDAEAQFDGFLASHGMFMMRLRELNDDQKEQIKQKLDSIDQDYQVGT